MNKFLLRQKTALVIGGSGNLGKAMIKKFRQGMFRHWNVFNIDVAENQEA